MTNRLASTLCSVLGFAAIWYGFGGSDGRSVALEGVSTSASASVGIPANQETLAIELVSVGHRVPAWNPELNAAEHDQPDPDAATWRKLTLRMAKGDGGRLDISLLRPLEWIDQTGAYPGQVINLDLPELGAQGDAQVLALAPCPEICPGRGRVVTGTFAHKVADNVFDVVLVNPETDQQSDRIGATGVHPFWSETRQAFVPAAELTPGDEVLAITGDRLRVASLLPRPGPERVYNLEVDGEHVYYVGASGTLVHNSYVLSYEIIDGVRRAKAADNYQHATIRATLVDRNDNVIGTFDVPIRSLHSPYKDHIPLVTQRDFDRWNKVLQGARLPQLPFPPITIRAGNQGPTIPHVGVGGS